MEDTGTAKSTLAIQHESIKEAVKVKEENINDYVSFLQSKIDELASVAEAGGADKDKVANKSRVAFVSTLMSLYRQLP